MNNMLELINYINIDENLKNKVIDLAHKDRVKILLLSNLCKDGNFSCLQLCNDLTRLAVIIKCAEFTKEKYFNSGINKSVLTDTLDDIRIWCENNNNKGLKNYNWLKNHINCELFKLGRLQFQLFKCTNKTLNYSKLPFKYGDNLIYIHIPQGEKLLYSDCVESLKYAVDFFENYFPEFHYNYFFCESWLLYDKNREFMDANSNIIRFASMFDVAYSVAADSQAIERIFGSRQINKKNYPEKTTLQRNAKAFMQKGGVLGIGIGYIDKNKMTTY